MVNDVFSSQFINVKYIKQLRILEKAIHQYNEGSLDAEYTAYDDITETPDMQQQSDDVMKANSKTAEENMVITGRNSSLWNEFLQKEHNDNESKEKQRISIIILILFDRLKRLYLPTIPLWTKIMQNKVKKNKSNEKFVNLPIRIFFAETNTNVQAEKCFKIKKYSSWLNENMNIAEFLRLNVLDNLVNFRISPEAIIRELASLKSKVKKKFSSFVRICWLTKPKNKKITKKTEVSSISSETESELDDSKEEKQKQQKKNGLINTRNQNENILLFI